MKRSAALGVLSVFAAVLALPVAAGAQDHYTYTISLLGGVGGAIDEDGAGLDNQALELGLSLLREDQVHVAARLGEIDFDASDAVGGAGDATLRYVVAGGEYRFLESFYESGIFAGLGFYELEGSALPGGEQSDSSVGLALGLTGEFEINRRVGVLVEFTGHVTDLEGAQIFGTGLIGLTAHF